MASISYWLPVLGDEYQMSECMCMSAGLAEMMDGTADSIAEWNQICNLEELRERILSADRTLVAILDTTIVSLIAFRRGNHLSLLFVRRDFPARGAVESYLHGVRKHLLRLPSMPLMGLLVFMKK